MLKYRKQFIFQQSIFIILSSAYLWITDGSDNIAYIYIGSIWLIATYFQLFINEIKYAPSFNPFMLLIIAAIQYVGFNGISLANDIAKGDPIYFGIYDISNYIAQGLFFMLLEHLLLLCGFYYIMSKHEETERSLVADIKKSDIPYYKLGINIYLITILIRIVNIFINLVSISAVFSHVIQEGQLVSLMFLSYEFFKNDPTKNDASKAFWIITVIEIILALGSGFKQPILMAILPYIIYLIIAYKAGMIKLNKYLIFRIGVIGVFIVYFVFPYISIFRSLAMKRHISWGEVSITETLSEYKSYVQNGFSIKGNDETDLDYVMSRAGAVGCNSWAIHYAQKNGNYPKYYTYCLSAIIPRILWPNKPPYIIGQMFFNLSTGKTNWEDQKSADASFTIGFIGSSYFGLGLFGALTLPLIAGLYCGWLWVNIRDKLYYNPVAVFIFFTLIISVFKDFEDFNDGGIIFYAFTLFYFALMKIFPFTKYKNR